MFWTGLEKLVITTVLYVKQIINYGPRNENILKLHRSLILLQLDKVVEGQNWPSLKTNRIELRECTFFLGRRMVPANYSEATNNPNKKL